MEKHELHPEIRWSDLDPNFHLRHSAYYDLGAYCRVSFLNTQGLTPEIMLQHRIGPILLREECLFRKEIKFGDTLTINQMLDKANEDFSRWTMVHEITKSEGVLAAVITNDGAWMDTQLRKLTKLPPPFESVFQGMPTTINYKGREKSY